MLVSFLLLILLVATTPVSLFLEGPLERAAAALAAAVAVAAVGVFVRAGEGGHLAKLLRPWAAVVAVPALWMLIQALPMPVPGLAHPIWASAAVGLDVPLIGAISIDPGMTLVGLGRYLFAVAVLGVATAIAIDRRRAEWMLYLLTGATAVMAGNPARGRRDRRKPRRQHGGVAGRWLCAGRCHFGRHDLSRCGAT